MRAAAPTGSRHENTRAPAIILTVPVVFDASPRMLEQETAAGMFEAADGQPPSRATLDAETIRKALDQKAQEAEPLRTECERLRRHQMQKL